MADNSKIEWTEATWNPITGCSVTSPGCKHCYAMRLAGGRMKNHPSRIGLTQPTDAGPVWTGEVRFNEQWLGDPLRWRRPRMIFVCAHSDLFHEDVPDEWIDRIFAVMAMCEDHTFQVLTKRPQRMREYVCDVMKNQSSFNRIADAAVRIAESPCASSLVEERMADPLDNVWLGVSVEDQKRADERIAPLLNTPAAIRWISAEPLLGPIDFNALSDSCENLNALTGLRENPFGDVVSRRFGTKLDWVVVGGESGPGARPMHPHWAENVIRDCTAADVPLHFKQWGAWVPALQFPPGIDDDPEQSRFASVVWDGSGWDETNGAWDDCEQWRIAERGDDPEQQMFRVGKGLAGRTIGGVVHDGFPEARR